MTYQTNTDPGDEYIDLRDLADKLNELREELECGDAETDPELRLSEDTRDALREEMDLIIEAESQLFTPSLDEYARNEPTAILSSDFEDYARQLADDLGMVDDESPLAFCVDWEKWADHLKM